MVGGTIALGREGAMPLTWEARWAIRELSNIGRIRNSREARLDFGSGLRWTARRMGKLPQGEGLTIPLSST